MFRSGDEDEQVTLPTVQAEDGEMYEISYERWSAEDETNEEEDNW